MPPNSQQQSNANAIFDEMVDSSDENQAYATSHSSKTASDFDTRIHSMGCETYNGKGNINANANVNVNETRDRGRRSTKPRRTKESDDLDPSAIIKKYEIQCSNMGSSDQRMLGSHHQLHPQSQQQAAPNTQGLVGEEDADTDSTTSSSTAASAIATATLSEAGSPFASGMDVDEMLSRELLKLSFQDRIAIDEEIHGVRCLAPEENPRLLSLALASLEREIERIPYKPAYDKAQAYALVPRFAKTSYVNTDDFRLKFLRCELFDVRKAAVRLIGYLELMVELYGLFALQRRVKLQDFSKEEMQILRSGGFQVFPFRDRSGRRVMCTVGNMGMMFDPTLRLKANFYFWMTAAESVESQQKGVVFLVWPGPNDTLRAIPNQTDRALHCKCNAAAPIRIAAVHFCLPNKPFFHLLRNIMAATLGLAYRLRLKFHVGEGVELQYRLKGYGIPVDLTPLTDSGNIKTMYLKQWLRLRKIIETGITPSGVKTSTVSIIECPGSNDVIFRPGTSMLCHPGNVAFRGLIEAKQNRITVKRAEKEEVALEIIQEVRSTGGRFLMWDNGGWWSELNDIPLISVKISISYRDFKTKVKTLVQQHQQEQQRKQQNLASATNAFLPGGDKKRKRSMIPTFCGTFE